MYTIYLDWSVFKTDVIVKEYPYNYVTKLTATGENTYEVFAVDRQLLWKTNVQSASEVTDFEDNYKAGGNTYKEPLDSDGKQFVRAESRPLDCTTVFITRADTASAIGDGKILSWDFSNSDDIITPPTDFKRKRLEFKFLDYVYVKEGTVYTIDAPYGCYVDFYVVCPAGQYYIKNDGSVALASVDTITAYFVVHHMMTGTVNMGDELNTESCSGQIPSAYKFWIDITVPDSDSVSKGHISMELYRKRTVVF